MVPLNQGVVPARGDEQPHTSENKNSTACILLNACYVCVPLSQQDSGQPLSTGCHCKAPAFFTGRVQCTPPPMG